MSTSAETSTPPWVLLYGRLGLIPFLAPGLAGWLWPAVAPVAGAALAVYAALILSFLGGARWGMAVTAVKVDPRTVSLAMLPSLAGLALLMLPETLRGWQLAGLGAAYGLQALWDLRAPNVPAWYAGLRAQLSLGAVAGLALGLAVFGV